MLNIQTKQVIEVRDWNRFVARTYGRPYNFQQQDGCKPRGSFRFRVPDMAEDYEDDNLPTTINDENMGVSFKAWLARDPKLCKGFARMYLDMFWERNFYPDVQMIANDLHNRGLLPAGEYTIEIDW